VIISNSHNLFLKNNQKIIKDKSEMGNNLPKDDNVTFTFNVDKVTPGSKKILEGLTPEEHFQNITHSKNKIEDFSHKNDINTKILIPQMNGVMNAVHWAFIQHYPLKLSVSDFILMIGQGLAKHMEVHAEELRPLFVDFEGKEKIVIERNDLLIGGENDWSTVFGEFSEAIKERVKTDFYDIMVDDTSVATKLSRIASEIAIMDAYKQYFDYEVTCICGIPKITLVGSSEDWEKLRKKVKSLQDLNKDDRLKLNWWLDRLVPLVDQIVDQATSRNIDRTFWTNIYHYQEKQSFYIPSKIISGWIMVFNPYLQRKTYKANEERCDYEYYQNEFGDVYPDSLIPGFSKVPFTWTNPGKKLEMAFYGGCLGARQLDDLQIEPVYFYAVVHENN